MSDDGDTGKNTGGMGAYSPAPVITSELHDYVMERVVYPTVRGMAGHRKSIQGCVIRRLNDYRCRSKGAGIQLSFR